MGKCQALCLLYITFIPAVCLYFIFVCLHSSVIGLRAPFLRVGGNTQFEMMNDQFFVYDTSIAAPLGRVPVWVRQFFVYIFSFVYISPNCCLFTALHFIVQNAPQMPRKCQ